MNVEIADTPASHSKGLMGRTSLPKGAGMLFVYERNSILSFWMKNTLIPLSLAFFDENQTLTEILDMHVPFSASDQLPVFKSSQLSRYALEAPQNWFYENDILPGMKFSFLDRCDPLD